MRNRSGEKIKLSGIDELLGVVNEESAMEIDIASIHPFAGHPFKVIDDDKMQDLVESVRENGVITPVLIRPAMENQYEMISGHRRMHAAKLAGLSNIPAIVREMTDDEAVIAMVDANIQREELLPSEKAFAYKLKYDALKHQGKISEDLTSYQLGTKYKTDSAVQIAQQEGTSRAQIYRYIRLTNLNEGLLDYLDQGRIAFNPAVELSYLSKRQQDILLEAINDLDATPSFSQAQYLRQLAKEGKYTGDIVYDVLDELKPNQKEKLKIDMEDLKDYFDRGTTPNEMIKIIKESLSQYNFKQNSKKEENDLKI